jgi:hypothetical protein
MPKRLPRSLSREECRGLLAQPSRRYPTGVRNRVVTVSSGYPDCGRAAPGQEEGSP